MPSASPRSLRSAEMPFAQRPLGIDVAQYQFFINWTNIKADSITFTWVKATESTDFVDPYFTTNAVAAKQVGILTGFYHFAHPERHLGLAGADAEAAFYWSVVSNYVINDGLTIMPVLDYETAPGSNYTKASSSQWVNEWCLDVVNYGYSNGVILNPVVYTDSGTAKTWLDNTVTQWPVWWPSHSTTPQSGGPSPTPWTTWTAWQYNQANLDGITNNEVDEDVFNGTAATLVSTLGVGSYHPNIYYWDPQGTNGPIPNTNLLTGNWEDNSWAAGPTGRITPVGWFEGEAACVGVNVGVGTPPFTLTMNQTHTVAGVFNGVLAPNACNLTINGPGTMIIQSDQGFATGNSSDGSQGITTINPVIAGTGEMVPQGNGLIYLNASNTYSGATQLGYTHGSFTGTIHFNNGSAFGTGAIVLDSFGNGGTFAVEGSAPITIPNSIIVSNNTTNIFIGNTAGVTYAGKWTLNSSQFTFGTGSTPGLLDIISGVVSGASGLTVSGSGTLSLQGTNTYTGTTTIQSPCTLSIGGSGQLGSGIYANSINNSGTFTCASAAPQTLTGIISGSGALNQNGPGTLTLSAANIYTGDTTINGGALVLGSSGSINNSSLLAIGPGGTFNVSAFTSYNLSGSTTLQASGNATPANIYGGSVVNLGSRPIILNYDGSHPALIIAQGTLSLSGNAFIVNGSILSGGVHPLIQQTTGTISSSGSFSVSGTAIPAMGANAAISVSGSNVLLTITDATTTTLGALAPSTYGQTVTFQATISPTPFGGTVQFSDSGVALGGPVPVIGGIASFATNGLAVGSHPIKAAYSGTTGYAASTTAGFSIQQVSLPPNNTPVTITNAAILANGTLQLNFSGVPGYTYLIEAATNLNPPAIWTTLATNTADINGRFNFTDLDATNHDGRYYRTAVQ